MQNVLEVSKRIWNAMQNEDVNQLTELIHQEAVFVHMGVTLTRDDEIDVIKNKRIIYKTVEFQEQTVKEMESTVVLLNKLKLTAIVGGNEVTNPFVVTEIYTEKDEELKLACMAYTRIIY